MAVVTINKVYMGDMVAHYILEDEIPELFFYPKGKNIETWESKKQNIENLIQIKIVGDMYTDGYSGGISMRQSESTEKMKFEKQEEVCQRERHIIKTICKDERGYEATHTLIWKEKSKSVESFVEFSNKSEKPVSLELLSSFSIGGISPFLKSDGNDNYYLHRVRGVWSEEGRLETIPLESLQLEPSWVPGQAVRNERFGTAGSLTVNKFFPIAVIEDRRNHVFWGAQVAHNASWQMEIYRRDEAISFSGGLADREFGHWVKKIQPGENFYTPSAYITTAFGRDPDEFFQRLVSCQEENLEQIPESEETLPLIFNEYCTTWGEPSHENIKQILQTIRGKGFSYFVIDCGWYKKKNIPWSESMGDYNPSEELFPEGLGKITCMIKEEGMKPGLWFEIDNVGKESEVYNLQEHLLKRDGFLLTTKARRFWDMRQSWVQNYLKEHVIDILKKYGFEYIKMDYNDTIGIGCDGAESLGEGLRQNMEASWKFIKKIKEEIPGIVIENCASGGHKLEPKMMGISSMASFSDAHECEEIPVIAANLHRVILPRQSQIWAVIRKEDDLKRIVYSISNTFFGRFCLSGDVAYLNKEQWEKIEAGICFYKKIAPVIKNGTTRFYGNYGKSWRHLQGWQGILREGENAAFAVFYVFDGDIPERVFVEWCGKDYSIEEIYSKGNVSIEQQGEQLVFKPTENREAVAVYMKRK